MSVKKQQKVKKEVQKEFLKFFGELQIIFEMYINTYNRYTNIKTTSISKLESTFERIDELKEKKSRTAKEKKQLQNLEGILYDNFKQLDETSQQLKKSETLGKQTLISFISNFELFRKKLITIAFKNFKTAKDAYVNVFNNCSLENYKKYNDDRYSGVRESDMIEPKNLKLIENQKKLTTAEKLMYNIDLNDESNRSIYYNSYQIFVMFREVRNMFSHRENKIDEIFYSSVKSGIPTKMFKSEKDFIFMLSILGLEKFGETGKKIVFNPAMISILFSELLNLSFIYCKSLFKENILFREIAIIYNDMLIDYEENNGKLSYLIFFKHSCFTHFTVSDLSKIDENWIEEYNNEGTIFLVNSILVYNELMKSHTDPEKFEYYERLTKTFLIKLKTLDKNKIYYKIIEAYLDNSNKRLIKLTKSVDKYLKSEKVHKKRLNDWFIFKSLKNEYFIQNYLRG
jgi:hypothetical protein